MPLTENSGQVFLPGGCNRTQNLRFGPYTINFLRTGQVQNNFDSTFIATYSFRSSDSTHIYFVYIMLCYDLDLIERLPTICGPCLFGLF